MNQIIICMGTVAGLLGSPALVRAVDRAAVEIGAGDENSTRGGAAVQWDWSGDLVSLGSWSLAGYWEASLSYWDGDNGRTGNGDLGEIGFTPVFRLLPRSQWGALRPYVEGGIGVHLMSDTEFGDRDFDIAFAFGDHLGTGVRFGANEAFEVGYRFQHLSNASIGDDNPGINFHLLRLGYDF